MSDDEDNLTIFGTLLPQFAEDEIPTKKPKTIVDQIAVDSNGKRRFHGAFTGGFSAGFWNTVGSQEGWTPKTFKSSRLEKAGAVVQAPGDFMDEEDTGEFGIAPHRIQTTAEFTDDRNDLKRARISLESNAPISGDPVKNLFLEPVKGKIALNLLRKMGWKDESGFRACLLANHQKPMTSTDAKVYHCDMGPMQRTSTTNNDDNIDTDDTDISQIILSSEKIVFKSNRFGLGYIGLTKYNLTQDASRSQHINLFAQLEAEDRMSKKVPIKGQAFGVGAFEEDDDDIYAREDISNYDFAMIKEQKSKKKLQSIDSTPSAAFPGCVKKKTLNRQTKTIFSIDLARDFQPTNWLVRKTRFGPTIHSASEDASVKIIDKTKSTPEERGKILFGDLKPIVSKIEPKSADSVVIDESKSKSPTPSSSSPLVTTTKPLPAQTNRSKSIIDKLAVDRFVSEKDIDTKIDLAPKELEAKTSTAKYEVNIKRTKTQWQPCKILCQKMNVCEPISGYKQTTNKPFMFFDNVALVTKNRQRKQETSFVSAIQSDDKELNDVIEKQKKVQLPIPIQKIDAKLMTVPPQSNSSTPSTAAVSSSSSLRTNINPFKPKVVKKTPLELRVLEEQDKHPVEKKDLFNSIFNSSSDEDTDNDDANDSNQKSSSSNLMKPDKLPAPENIMSLFDKPKDNLIEPTNSNIIESSQPIVIMADIPKPVFIPKSKPMEAEVKNYLTINAVEIETDNFVYGPMMPALPPSGNNLKITKPLLQNIKDSDSNDSWIEKSSDDKNKERHRHKKSKKHKKHKHKSKKSKR